MSSYPAAIYAPRTMVNRVGVVYDVLKTKVIYAEDLNKDRDELVAIETALGINLSKVAVLAGVAGGQTFKGGSAVADVLKLQGTSGNGTLTSPAVQCLVGNNGATVACTVLNNGNVGIGTTGPGAQLDISKSSGYATLRLTGNVTSDNDVGDIDFYNAAAGGSHAYFYTQRTGANNSIGFAWQVSNAGNPGNAMYIQPDGDVIVSAGNVGIGITSPTAVLHLKAGTATASTAPLKFTSGVNLTTPVSGNMEYDNNFHLTISDAVRRSIVLAPNATKVTAAAPYTNDGYVVMNILGTDFKIMTTA